MGKRFCRSVTNKPATGANYSVRCLAGLAVVSAFLFLLPDWHSVDAVAADKKAGTKKAPAPKNVKATTKKKKGRPNKIEVEEPELVPLGFDQVKNLEAFDVKDGDETPEGQQQMTAVLAEAKSKNREYHGVLDRRRLPASRRAAIVGEMNSNLVVINQNEAVAADISTQLGLTQRQADFAITAAEKNQARSIINTLTNRLNDCKRTIDTAVASNVRLQPQLENLNQTIKPLDDELIRLWNEMNSCRQQWLEIRAPFAKYTRLEFENLKTVLDDWSRTDGLWPQVHIWSALCSYELGDYQKAVDCVQTVDRIRKDNFYFKPWPQVEAMKGLLSLTSPAHKKNADRFLATAWNTRNKKADWETPYIVGLAREERGGASSAPLAAYQESNKLFKANTQKDNLIIDYHVAVLQTTGDEKTLRPEEGAKKLEEIWIKTGKRSWRISYALAQAYQSCGRQRDAESQLADTVNLAPRNYRQQLALDRAQSELREANAPEIAFDMEADSDNDEADVNRGPSPAEENAEEPKSDSPSPKRPPSRKPVKR